jgi:hypothetical protein
MTRTSSVLILALVTLGAAIAPAAASDSYRSINSITAGDAGEQGQSRSSDYTSLTAAVGADSSERSPVTSAYTDPSSLNAVLATAPEGGPASAGSGNGYRSVNAIVGGGSPQPSPTAVVEVPDGDGFDWLDALIGALIASGLTLMTLAAARSVARHRRATAESRA